MTATHVTLDVRISDRQIKIARLIYSLSVSLNRANDCFMFSPIYNTRTSRHRLDAILINTHNVHRTAAARSDDLENFVRDIHLCGKDRGYN